jgi:hypothetical protein
MKVGDSDSMSSLILEAQSDSGSSISVGLDIGNLVLFACSRNSGSKEVSAICSVDHV